MNTDVMDCRRGPTLSCLVADKKCIPKLQLRMGEGEFKKVGLRKEQAKLEKEDVNEVEGGR